VTVTATAEKDLLVAMMAVVALDETGAGAQLAMATAMTTAGGELSVSLVVEF